MAYMTPGYYNYTKLILKPSQPKSYSLLSASDNECEIYVKL